MPTLFKPLSVCLLSAALASCTYVSDSYDYLSTSIEDVTTSIGEAFDGTMTETEGLPGDPQNKAMPEQASQSMPLPQSASVAASRNTTSRGVTKQPKYIVELSQLLNSPSPDRDVAVIQFIQGHPHTMFPDLTQHLVAHAASLPPLVLYELAGRMYAVDRWKGVQWYYAARVRYTYDLMRCTDGTVMGHLDRADQIVVGPKTQIRLDPATAYGTALAGLRWEKEASVHRVTPLPTCLSGDKSVRVFGVNGLTVKRLADKRVAVVGPTGQEVNPDNWIKPIPTHAGLLDQARLRVRKEAEKLPSMPAKLPKEWDD